MRGAPSWTSFQGVTLGKPSKEAQTDCLWGFEGLLKGKYKWYIGKT